MRPQHLGSKNSVILGLLCAVVVLLPNLVFAGNWAQTANANTTIGNDLCGIALSFSGEVAAGIGTIAICSLGAMACIGRVQWSTALVVATGIAVLFGAAALVGTIGSKLNPTHDEAIGSAWGGCT